MVLTTQEHRKRKAECLEVIEAISALCLMECLGIVDLNEEELALVLGFAGYAFDTMTQLPRSLTPVNPFNSKDDLQFEFAFRFTKEEAVAFVHCE